MIEIILTQGDKAIIDDEDYKLVNQYKWWAEKRTGVKNIYAVTYERINKKKINTYMHRFLMKLKTYDSMEIDHINGNGLDNRKENLRFCTRSQNNMNSRKRRNTYSSYKGVSWSKERRIWKSRIWINGKCKNIGNFVNELDAALAYNNFAKKYYGKFARINELSKT